MTIFQFKTFYTKLIYILYILYILYKTGPELLRIRFDKIDEFMKVCGDKF